MKKRLLVLLAFGVSFTPAAFAADGAEYHLPSMQVGEYSQNSEFRAGSTVCDRQKKLLAEDKAAALGADAAPQSGGGVLK